MAGRLVCPPAWPYMPPDDTGRQFGRWMADGWQMERREEKREKREEQAGSVGLSLNITYHPLPNEDERLPLARRMSLSP